MFHNETRQNIVRVESETRHKFQGSVEEVKVCLFSTKLSLAGDNTENVLR